MERTMRILGDEHGTRFEFECYDVGHLYSLAHLLDRGLVRPPLFVQTIFGILGGIGADPENLAHMRAIADKLFGDDYDWSVLAAGRHQMASREHGRADGRERPRRPRGQPLPGEGPAGTINAEQVAKIRRILEELSLDIATPDEARAMLDLKGRANTGFV